MFIDHKSLSLAFDHATSSKTSSSITSFIDEEIEASKNQVTCPKLHSTLEEDWGFQVWVLTLSTPPPNSLLPPWRLKTLLKEGVRPAGTNQREDWQQTQALAEPSAYWVPASSGWGLTLVQFLLHSFSWNVRTISFELPANWEIKNRQWLRCFVTWCLFKLTEPFKSCFRLEVANWIKGKEPFSWMNGIVKAQTEL